MKFASLNKYIKMIRIFLNEINLFHLKIKILLINSNSLKSLSQKKIISINL